MNSQRPALASSSPYPRPAFLNQLITPESPCIFLFINNNIIAQEAARSTVATKRKLSDKSEAAAEARPSKRLTVPQPPPAPVHYSIVDNSSLHQYPAWLANGCPADGCRAGLQARRVQQYGSVPCMLHRCFGPLKHETKYYFSKRTKVTIVINIFLKLC